MQYILKSRIFIAITLALLGAIVYLMLSRQSIQANSPKIQLKFCKNFNSNSARLQCWEDLIDTTLAKQGLDKAFVLMDNLFQSEPVFASECHGFAHTLGEKAYGLFSQNKDFSLSPQTSYCGYGFYHGFMEKLLHSSGTLAQAQDFCKWAGEKLKQTTSDAEGACYHGIGHGAVEDVTDPKLFGNPQAIIAPSLDLCEKVSQTPDKLFRCITGVFNALEIVTSQGKYNLSLNYQDPLLICRTQPNNYKQSLRTDVLKRGCYTQMVVAVMNVTGNDFVKSAKILDTIPENEWATESLSGLVVELVRLNRVDYKETVDFCHSLSARFQMPCITGFGEGFLKYGPPQTEYIKAINFCSSHLLTDPEQQTCFQRVLSILRIWYTSEKSKQICQSVDPKYQWNNCQYN